MKQKAGFAQGGPHRNPRPFTCQVGPSQHGSPTEHCADAVRGKWHKRFKRGRQGRHELGRDAQNGCGALGVRLDHLPRRLVGEVLVADAGQIHRMAKGLAELKRFKRFSHQGRLGRHRAQRLAVSGKGTGRRHGSATKFMVEHHHAVDEVAQHGDQLRIVALLKVGPGEVVVFGLRHRGGEHVAQHVLLAGEVRQVFVQPHGPVARGRQLLTLEVQEFVGRNLVGQNVPAVLHQNGRKNHAVKDDVVLADKVNEAGRGVLPPGLPVVALELLGGGDVAQGRVKPHVEHLAVGAFDRNRYAPIQIARHRARLQAVARVEPAQGLAVDVGLPLGVRGDVAAQVVRQLVERQKPVGGGLEHGRGAAQRRPRVDQVGGIQRGSALLALVAVGGIVAAARTGSDNIAVGQKLLGLGVKVLVGLPRLKYALVVKGFEKIRGHLLVAVAAGARVVVKGDSEVRKGVAHHDVVPVDDFAWSHPLFARLHRDGHSVLVRPADKGDLFDF